MYCGDTSWLHTATHRPPRASSRWRQIICSNSGCLSARTRYINALKTCPWKIA